MTAALRLAGSLFAVLAVLATPGTVSAQNPAQWIQVNATGTPPSARYGVSSAFDLQAQDLVIFGGNSNGTLLNDIWTLSVGSSTPQWTQIIPGVPDEESVSPSPRTGAAADYDSRNANLMIFGGATGSDVCANDSWVLSHATGSGGTPIWTQLTFPPSVASPTPRQGASAVYDPVSNSLIIFGGNCGSTFFSDTWVLSHANGTGGTPTWTQLGLESVPTARSAHTAVYDSISNSMIVFGGSGTTGVLNDVWVLSHANDVSGTPAWTQIRFPSSAALPSPRQGAAAAYNPDLRQLTIFGGGTGSDAFLNDTWLLTDATGATNGTTMWVQLQPSGAPTARESMAGVFNPFTNQLVIFGGQTASGNPVNDTWDLSLEPQAPVTLTAINGNNQSTQVTTAFNAPLQAYVADATGIPVPDETVSFNTNYNSVTLNNSSPMTDEGGVATAIATAGQYAESNYSVTASEASISNAVSFTLTNTAGPPYSVSYAYGSGQKAAINKQFKQSLQAMVSDIYGNAVQGITVNFSSPFSGAGASLSPNSVSTDSNGDATVTATANSFLGSYTVTATANGTQVGSPVSFNLTNQRLVSVGLTPSANPVRFGSQITLTANVSPTSATGTVTFYEGVTVLGIAPLANGIATFTTILPFSGTQKLTALYNGDSTYASLLTAAVSETVNPTPASSVATGSINAVGTSPVSVAIGDFNGDGIPDMAVANSGNNTVSVLIGQGSGNFASAVTYTVGSSPASVAIGDFNNDGKLDLAVACTNGINILLGNGAGTFTLNSSTVSVPYGTPNFVAVADFNQDGNADLLVGVSDEGFGYGFALTGNGALAFTEMYNFYGATAMQVADVNNDGNPDVVYATSFGYIYTYLGNGFTTSTPFTYNNEVYDNGLAITAIALGDFNGDGNVDLAFLDSSDHVNIALNNGAEGGYSFGSTTPYPAGTKPNSLLAADMNGDGSIDLVVTDSGSNSVNELLNSGTGTFGPPTVYPVGNGPIFAAVSDLNNDGRPDLAVVNETDKTVGILLGEQAPTSITATAGTAQSATITTAFATQLQATVTDAAGLPVPGVTVTFSAPTSGASASLSSMTATTNSSGIATTTATANTITGTYNVTASVSGISSPATFALTNTSGAPSAITAVAGSLQTTPFNTAFAVPLQGLVTDSAANPVPGVMVTFKAPTSGASATFPSPSAVTNSSGVASVIATANNVAGIYQVVASVAQVANTAAFSLTNTTPQQQGAALLLTSSSNPSRYGSNLTLTASVTSASGGLVTFYDGTTILDTKPLSGGGQASISTVLLASGTHKLTALYKGTTATYSASLVQVVTPVAATTLVDISTNPLSTNSVSAAISDFNGDGKLDLAVVSTNGPNTLTILLGNGDGTFTSTNGYNPAPSLAAVAVGDFNDDGIPDLAVVSASQNQVIILLGNGDGTFTANPALTVGSSPSSVKVGDFNGDGQADLAVTNASGNNVSILLGNGDGTFAPAVNYAAPQMPVVVSVGDFNGDGKPDLAIVGQTSNTVGILLGNGDGTFGSFTSYAVGTSPDAIAVADFNGDGVSDLAVTNSGNHTVSVLLGNANGTFGAATAFGAGTNPSSVRAADLNGDGKVDLAVTDTGANVISVLLGNGDGTFGSPTTYTVAQSPQSAVVGDFNDDGKADLAVVSSNTLSVLLGAPLSQTLSITTTSLPSGTLYTSYSASIAAQGGTQPYRWSIVSGSLPPGLALNSSSGVISGLPVGPAGTATFSVRVTDSSSPAQTFTAQLQIVMQPATLQPLSVSSSLPIGVVGTQYSQALSVTGGVSPYTWTVTSGTLPAGFALNQTSGIISGTPTAPSVSAFTVTVQDSIGEAIKQGFSITVNPVISLVVPSGTQQPQTAVSNGTLSAAQTPAAPVTGTVVLSFEGNASGLPTPYVNPGVCFSSTTCGSSPVTSTSFTLAAGSTSIALPAVQTGTVAGTIQLNLSVPGQPTTTSTVTVPRVAPVIEANSVQILDVTSTGFVVELVATSTPRDVQAVNITFNPAMNSQINGTSFTVNVSSLLSQWYSGAAGQSYGSAFSLQIPFNLSGDAKAIGSVTVTLTNSVGTSAPVTGTQ